jgi:hypothetical protein
MNKSIVIVGVAALALSVAACNRGARDQQSSNTVTVAGCVQTAEQGLASPASGNTNADKFVLTNASLAAGSAASPSPSSSTAPRSDAPSSDSAPASPAPTASIYMLDGKTSELREHVNHQVEITGRLEANRSSDTANRSADSTAPSASADNGRELHVESLRMIAANCSR